MMSFNTIRESIRAGFDRAFGSGAFQSQFGNRETGPIPLAEAASLALTAQAPQSALTTPPAPPAAPAATPGPAAEAQALFARIDALTGELSTAKATIAGLQDSKTKLEADLAVCKTKIATFDNQLASAAAKEAAHIVASCGLPHPIKVSEISAPAPTSTAQVFEQYNALTDPRARADFFQKHKAQLLSV